MGHLVVVSMLRGVNVGGHNRIKMDALRSLYESLGLSCVQTYVQSGNVVCKTKDRNLTTLGKRIGTAIEKKFGFRPAVMLRTTSELRRVVASNPFARRKGVEPNRLLVNFLQLEPDGGAGAQLKGLGISPEELHLLGRELYIYFPDGMGRSKLPWTKIDKVVKTSSTGRNWNTVTTLLTMAERLEG